MRVPQDCCFPQNTSSGMLCSSPQFANGKHGPSCYSPASPLETKSPCVMQAGLRPPQPSKCCASTPQDSSLLLTINHQDPPPTRSTQSLPLLPPARIPRSLRSLPLITHPSPRSRGSAARTKPPSSWRPRQSYSRHRSHPDLRRGTVGGAEAERVTVPWNCSAAASRAHVQCL